MEDIEEELETDFHRWSPWTAPEGIDAYIRSRQADGWTYHGQLNQPGGAIVLVFKHPRGQ